MVFSYVARKNKVKCFQSQEGQFKAAIIQSISRKDSIKLVYPFEGGFTKDLYP